MQPVVLQELDTSVFCVLRGLALCPLYCTCAFGWDVRFSSRPKLVRGYPKTARTYDLQRDSCIGAAIFGPNVASPRPLI